MATLASNAVVKSASGAGYLQTYLYKKVLPNFEPMLRMYEAGEKPVTPSGYGTVSWAKPSQLTVTAATATLTEGTVPTSTAFTYSTITLTPVQYGIFVEISDRLLKAAPTKILDNAAVEIGNNMARIVDNVIQTAISAGTAVLYQGSAFGSGTRAGLGAGNVIVANDVRKAVAHLRTVNAPDFDGYMLAYMHEAVAADLRGETNGQWIEFSKYVTPDKLFKGEIGALHGARVVTTANIQTFASTVTVYPTYFLGRGAYGVSEWSSMETIYQPLGSGGNRDPLNQVATVGAKIDFGAIILQQASLLRVESAAGTY